MNSGEMNLLELILGASLPAAALASAVQRLGPAVVFVWAQIPDTADPDLLRDLPAVRPAATVLIGGPGWRADTGVWRRRSSTPSASSISLRVSSRSWRRRRVSASVIFLTGESLSALCAGTLSVSWLTGGCSCCLTFSVIFSADCESEARKRPEPVRLGAA